MNKLLTLCVVWLAFSVGDAYAAPVINEFAADNADGLTDQDGATSDWIEIYNPDPTPVNLENWSLTDTPALPGKWRFPAVTLQPGGFLIVFASGKDRRVADAELHTNFELSKDGEFLALVHPDGQTIATQFTPAFPPQRGGYSYGRAQDVQTASLIGSVVPTYLVPTSAEQLPADWNQATLSNTSGWQNGTGTGAIGYDTEGAQPGSDTNIARSGTATQTTTSGGFTANLAIDGNTTNFTHTTSTDTAPRWTLNLGGRKLIGSIIIANRVGCCGSRLRDITVRVKDSDNTTVVYTSPLLNPENNGFFYPNGPASLTVDFNALFGGQIIGQYVEILRTPDPDLSGTQGQGNADERAALSMSEVTVNGQNFTGYNPFITTNVKTSMLNVNSSVFVRWPFEVPDPSLVTALRLRIRYDDAFVAYVNGVEIARRSAPASTPWNAAAPSERNDTLGLAFEDIDVNAFRSALRPGNNVLAIQGMTSAPGDSDFLLQPQLVADSMVVNQFHSFLRTLTPGALNDSTWFESFVADTNFSVKRGFFSSPFDVTIATPTSGAEIYYSTNGEEPEPGNGTLYTGPIAISKTTILRARAFKPNWEPTNTDTNTYIFLSDVLGQASNGQPPPGWPSSPILNGSGQQQQLNYGMDPNVRTLYGNDQLFEALRQIPTISVVTEMGNLFDPETGIYANASEHGDEWERPASMEWLDPSSTAGAQGKFQANFGLRIRGGASRNPSFVKHSFRAYFRGNYGTKKLEFPIYGDRGARDFDVIDLASSQNYSWAANGPSTGDYDTMLRDPFSRETLVATGSPGSRNRHFHLYLNGLYWGIYYFDERPSPGYGTSYFGGKKGDYDVVKTGNHSQGFVTEATEGFLDTMPGPNGTTIKAPWRELWDKARAFATAPGVTQTGNPNNAAYYEMLGRNADGTRNPSLPVLVDVDSLIDYMLVIFYTGDGDAPLSSFLENNRANNWFALRDRANPNMGFVFINHDAEHTLGAPNSQLDRTGPFNGTNQTNFAYSNPQWLFQDLAFSPEFRLRVADHIHQHFFQGGVMTAAAAQARLDALAAQINLAVKAHSQRWGDTKKTPAYNAANWQSAVTFARNWLTSRTGTVLQQLRNYRLRTIYPTASAPLYPSTAAPTFNQNGGSVPAGFTVSLTATAGEMRYTVNGDDPRNGTVYSDPITLTTPGLFVIKARALVGTQWSAMATATFIVATPPAKASDIVVSEIHYHPADQDTEFIELQNISTNPVDLSGAHFEAGIEYTIPAGTILAPGARLVIKEGQYGGSLSDGGEQLILRAADNSIIRDFTYDDGGLWPSAPDGDGPSLVLIAPSTNPDHKEPANWRASATPGGNPGTHDATTFTGNPTADVDNDGLPALLEYAFGTTDNSSGSTPITAGSSGNHATISFPRAAGADDITYIVEYSTDLATWKTGPEFVEPVTHGPPTAVWRAVPQMSANEKQFLRVRISPR